ncbi:glycosyltransferase family 4 protein [Arcobacter sp. 15-2]|uniref:glycosyltransferase n=1 Tax=Arcobacter sp. 15-2 TaxID=3374109 RepID=UPI00399CD740
MKNKILIIHYEFYKNYLNKNIGYFIDSAISKGYEVDFLTLSSNIHENLKKDNFKIIPIDENHMESINLYLYIFKNRSIYKYVWIYPSYKYINFLLLFLRILDVKPIIKTDSMIIKKYTRFSPYWIRQQVKKKLTSLLAYKIIVENKKLLDFYSTKKTLQYSLGLPQKNLDIIKELSTNIKKEKTILYIGRINHAKGLDRLIEVFERLIMSRKINNEFNLKIVGKVVEQEYYNNLFKKVQESDILKTRVSFQNERNGKDYYKEILKASLVVLPTRNEGLPNILADCYFCKTLFLTTKGAKASDIILDNKLFCENDEDSLYKCIENVLNSLDNYYANYYSHYNGKYFVEANSFFEEFLND